MESKERTVDDMADNPRASSYRHRKQPHYSPDTPAEQLPEYLTSWQAAIWLGISRRRMGILIAEGTLQADRNPLDSRYKIMRRDAVVALKARSLDPRLAVAS
jgi:hypothetical protein